MTGPRREYAIDDIKHLDRAVHFFGDHVAFDKEAWLRDGTLSRLTTAFSRDQASKVYVQHRIAEHGAELFRWLEEGAHLYVCGDAERMAPDVDEALRQVIAAHGGRSADAAADYLLDLKRARRYQRDVY